MRWDLFLPNFGDIIAKLEANPEYYLENWWETFSIASSASGLALITAMLAAVLSVRFLWIEMVMSPAVVLSQSFPLQALAPLLIVALGVGFVPKLFIAWLICLFPIYSTVTASLKETPPNFSARLRLTRSTFLAGMLSVRIPAALPAIITAMQIGFTLAVLGAVVAEFIDTNAGLGKIILIAHSSWDASAIYLCVFMLMSQGLLVYGALAVVGMRIRKNRAAGRQA